MTHPGILKINELFNNKLSKEISNIKVSVTYKANFLNMPLFQNLRKVVRAAGYTDVKGQLDTIFCIIDGLRNNEINQELFSKTLSGNERTYEAANWVLIAFNELLKLGKVSFDDRIRRDILMCIYLDKEHVNFKTSFLKLDQQKKLFDNVISLLIRKGLITIAGLEYRIDSTDFYQQIYNNAKSVISNMHSRGISTFAIACYFWIKNREFLPKPFLYNWSSLNFMKAVFSTVAFETLASEDIKERIALLDSRRISKFVYWTVLSEISLLTGKVNNIDKNRRELNEIINKVLNAEGEQYIREYLKKIKLVQSSTPILGHINSPKGFFDTFYKGLEQSIRNELRDKTIEVPAKELIIEAIKYQFMISRVTGIDFSSKRKDHLILDKNTKQRIFEI